MDEKGFKQMLEENGYDTADTVEMAAGTVNDTHSHDFDAALLILSGDITVTTTDGATTCRAGDTFQLENGIPHTEHIGNDGVRFLVGRR